jgi:hypothetical protein
MDQPWLATYGTFRCLLCLNVCNCIHTREWEMNSVIYLVGLIVVIAAVLSFFGLR